MVSLRFVERLSDTKARITALAALNLLMWTLAPVRAAEAVNPGDQLNVTVYNHPELSAQVKVDSQGGISLPVTGYLNVAGLSLKTIDDRIAHRLKPYIKFPAVDVQSLGETESVFIAGGPGGVLVFSPGETLSTALADVQKNLEHNDPQENNRLELTDVIDHSRLDLRRVGLLRGGKQIGLYDTIAMRATGDAGPMLYANDTIVFRNKPLQVNVTGYVAKPGAAYLDPNEPLSDAIEQAGGALPTAATAHVALTAADGSKTFVALGDPVFASPPAGGESIMIPAAPRVQVNGLVAKPGPVALQSDFTLLGAINSAGGINKYANIKDVQVVRDGTASRYDITRLTFGDMSQNPVLKDGDSVFVPEGHKIDFTTVFGEIIGLRTFLPYNY
jgi:polysaccharide export outer membrane protein